MEDKIIGPEEVIDALVNGFEVLWIDKQRTVARYGISCRPLTREVYKEIEYIVENSDETDIFIRTEKEVKEEVNENEK